jgi:hypothetical protein
VFVAVAGSAERTPICVTGAGPRIERTSIERPARRAASSCGCRATPDAASSAPARASTAGRCSGSRPAPNAGPVDCDTPPRKPSGSALDAAATGSSELRRDGAVRARCRAEPRNHHAHAPSAGRWCDGSATGCAVAAGNVTLTGLGTRPIILPIAWRTRRGGWATSLTTPSSPIAWDERA